jgi:hypothetical protein
VPHATDAARQVTREPPAPELDDVYWYRSRDKGGQISAGQLNDLFTVGFEYEALYFHTKS